MFGEKLLGRRFWFYGGERKYFLQNVLEPPIILLLAS